MSANEVKHPGLNLGGTDELTHEQAGTAVFGFWVFLMSDAVLFALLFATYGVMLHATVGGPTPASEYKILPAFLETLALLTSSFTLRGFFPTGIRIVTSCGGDGMNSRTGPFIIIGFVKLTRCTVIDSF